MNINISNRVAQTIIISFSLFNSIILSDDKSENKLLIFLHQNKIHICIST